MVVTKIGGHHYLSMGGAQGCKSQGRPPRRRTAVRPFYVIKITYILHSFQITKLSRNAATKILSLSWNLSEIGHGFRKPCHPLRAGPSAQHAVTACVCGGCTHGGCTEADTDCLPKETTQILTYQDTSHLTTNRVIPPL